VIRVCGNTQPSSLGFSALSASNVGSAEFRKENKRALGPISGIEFVEILGQV
jgi:hypothetical protein